MPCAFCQLPVNDEEALQTHHQSECWIVRSKASSPEKWNPTLEQYILQTLAPGSQIPGWSTQDLVRTLFKLIHTSPTKIVDWSTLPLIQDIIAKGGPGQRRPQHIHIPGQLLPPPPFPSPPPTPLPLSVPSPSAQQTISPLQSLSPCSSPTPHQKLYPAERISIETPRNIYPHRKGRFLISKENPFEFLVYADGVREGNGQRWASGGCAFIFRWHDEPSLETWKPPLDAHCHNGTLFFRLEDVGSSKTPIPPTPNRAELRAVVVVLDYLQSHNDKQAFGVCPDLEWWQPKEKAKVVIAIDSEDVVKGATKWVKTWETNGWKTREGNPVPNQDLWELLLSRARELLQTRCQEIAFWKIPTYLNKASLAANYAATLPARKF